MKKTDIGVVAFMYAICGLFYYLLGEVKESARTYPRLIIIILFALTTLYLVSMLIGAKKNGVTGGTEMFKGFLPKQFFVVFILIIVYLALNYIVGFYIATVIFMAACLLFLKVPKWHIAIAIVAIIGLVYCAFTLFLKVKLPVGLLFK